MPSPNRFIRRRRGPARLLRDSAAGDAAAFEELYRTFTGELFGFLLNRVREPELARDLLAETFASALQNVTQFRGENDESARAWLYGIARNKLHGWFRSNEIERRATQRIGLDLMVVDDREADLLRAFAADVLAPPLSDAFEALTEEQRHAVQERVIEERGYEEIAGASGVTEQVARARVSRGLRAMASELAPPDEKEAS